MQAVKDMVADLSQLIDAHNRGEDTDERFARVHGQARRSSSRTTRSPSRS